MPCLHAANADDQCMCTQSVDHASKMPTGDVDVIITTRRVRTAGPEKCLQFTSPCLADPPRRRHWGGGVTANGVPRKRVPGCVCGRSRWLAARCFDVVFDLLSRRRLQSPMRFRCRRRRPVARLKQSAYCCLSSERRGPVRFSLMGTKTKEKRRKTMENENKHKIYHEKAILSVAPSYDDDLLCNVMM